MFSSVQFEIKTSKKLTFNVDIEEWIKLTLLLTSIACISGIKFMKLFFYIWIVFCHTLEYFACRVCLFIVELIKVKIRMNELCSNDLFSYHRGKIQTWLLLLVGL